LQQYANDLELTLYRCLCHQLRCQSETEHRWKEQLRA